MTAPLLESYVAGRWYAAPDDGTPIADAVTGETVARVSSTGLDVPAMLHHARTVGGPALRELTFHQRAALQRRRRFDRVVTDLVRAAEEEGDVRPDVDPAITSRLLFGTVNSLTEWYRPDGGLSADDLADALVATTFQGLRARTS